MTYLYTCPKCKINISIDKPMKDSSKDEYCNICKTKLKREYKLVIKTNDGVKS